MFFICFKEKKNILSGLLRKGSPALEDTDRLVDSVAHLGLHFGRIEEPLQRSRW